MMNEGYHMGEDRGATLVEAASVLPRRPRFSKAKTTQMLLSRARRSSDDEGAVLVEFALVIGLFFLLVFGMVDFGLAINTKTQITNAGREGARFGTVNLDPVAVEDRVREAGANLDQDVLKVIVTCQLEDDSPCIGGAADGDLSNGTGGDSVVVTVDYQYSMITPLPGFIDSDNKIDLQSITEMRIE